MRGCRFFCSRGSSGPSVPLAVDDDLEGARRPRRRRRTECVSSTLDAHVLVLVGDGAGSRSRGTLRYSDSPPRERDCREFVPCWRPPLGSSTRSGLPVTSARFSDRSSGFLVLGAPDDALAVARQRAAVGTLTLLPPPPLLLPLEPVLPGGRTADEELPDVAGVSSLLQARTQRFASGGGDGEECERASSESTTVRRATPLLKVATHAESIAQRPRTATEENQKRDGRDRRRIAGSDEGDD